MHPKWIVPLISSGIFLEITIIRIGARESLGKEPLYVCSANENNLLHLRIFQL